MMSSGDPTGEWDGLEGPGLVLASEDIRGAVEDILAGEGAGRPLEALVTVGELVVSLELLELRQAPEDVTIVGSCDLSAARSLVGLDLSEWSDVEIFHGSETLIEFVPSTSAFEKYICLRPTERPGEAGGEA